MIPRFFLVVIWILASSPLGLFAQPSDEKHPLEQLKQSISRLDHTLSEAMDKVVAERSFVFDFGEIDQAVKKSLVTYPVGAGKDAFEKDLREAVHTKIESLVNEKFLESERLARQNYLGGQVTKVAKLKDLPQFKRAIEHYQRKPFFMDVTDADIVIFRPAKNSNLETNFEAPLLNVYRREIKLPYSAPLNGDPKGFRSKVQGFFTVRNVSEYSKTVNILMFGSPAPIVILERHMNGTDPIALNQLMVHELRHRYNYNVLPRTEEDEKAERLQAIERSKQDRKRATDLEIAETIEGQHPETNYRDWAEAYIVYYREKGARNAAKDIAQQINHQYRASTEKYFDERSTYLFNPNEMSANGEALIYMLEDEKLEESEAIAKAIGRAASRDVFVKLSSGKRVNIAVEPIQPFLFRWSREVRVFARKNL